MLKPEEIYALIQDDATSERKRSAEVGRRYYDGKHDIQNYKLYYYNADGKLVEDTTRSNIKISHPFFTELVDQCVQYMLSGKESFVKSDNPELQSELDLYFGDDFKSELAETLTDTCTCGFGHMYAYKNKDNTHTIAGTIARQRPRRIQSGELSSMPSPPYRHSDTYNFSSLATAKSKSAHRTIIANMHDK